MGLIAQLVEHCSANAEATGSNPVEAAKKPFFRATSLLHIHFKIPVLSQRASSDSAYPHSRYKHATAPLSGIYLSEATQTWLK